MPQTVSRPKTAPSSQTKLYLQTLVFSVGVFGFSYWYITYLKIPNALNKAVADTAVIVMGLSMILSSLAYFFNLFDRFIVYRKQLGLVGFGFAVAHLVLSWSAFMRLFTFSNWQQGTIWPLATAAGATLIFSLMALMSVNWVAKMVGGKTWKRILRAGYLAFILVAAHVVLLRLSRWTTWWEGGMQSPPSLSLLAFVFIIVVVGARLLLWLATSTKSHH